MNAGTELNGFRRHGTRFKPLMPNTKEARGSCHLCGSGDHLYVNISTLLWHCKSCGESGNFERFLQQRQEGYRLEFARLAASTPSGHVAQDIQKDRGLKLQTLLDWGVGWTGKSYTIPCDGNYNRTMTDVQFWTSGKKLMASPSGKSSPLVPLSHTTSKRVWLCEGGWDGMVASEILAEQGKDDSVIAVAGAGSIPKDLLPMLTRRDVIVVFDHDDSGMKGCQRIAKLAPGTASSVVYVHWPSSKPQGYDLRDAYKESGYDAQKTHDYVLSLTCKATPGSAKKVPPPKTSQASQVLGTAYRIRKAPKGSFIGKPHVDSVFRHWLQMDSTLSMDVFFGTVFANRLEGDPIWMFFVAPPGGMKTELLMSIHESPIVEVLTSLTPATLISGATMAGGGDPSLLAVMDQRLLVIKDFTAILTLNPLAISEILGTLRDVYDGEITKRWGTGLVRHYKCKFGIIAGVTPVIEASASVGAMLGERFLKFNIPHAGHLSGRRSILNKALSNLPQTIQMRKALADVALKVLDTNPVVAGTPILPPDLWKRLIDVSLWAATLRGVVLKDPYSKVIRFKPTHEIGTRLARQLCKLAYGISIYKREAVVSEETFEVVCQVARDSIPQIVGEVVKQLYVHQKDPNEEESGLSYKDLVRWTHLSLATVDSVLSDLHLLGVTGCTGRLDKKWSLSLSMHRLMSSLEFYQRELNWYRHHK